MKTIMNLLRNLGILKVDVGAPVHVGANPVILTDLYRNEQGGWIFSFTDQKANGGVFGPYFNQEDAESMRESFVEMRKNLGINFVHQGIAYRAPEHYLWAAAVEN